MNHPRTVIIRFLLATGIGAGAALTAACGGPPATSNDPATPGTGPPIVAAPSASSSPSATSPSATPSRPPVDRFLPQGWRRCVNTVEGFSVGYPRAWHTTEVRPREACRQFHPTAFEIPRDGEYPLTALNVGRVDALPGRADTIHERVLLWEETTVSGRQAVRAETESTGEGLHPVGTRWYGYTIRIGSDLVRVFAAADPGAGGYSDWKAVVDQAARTLRRT